MIEDQVIELLQKVRPLGDVPVEIVPATEAEIEAFEQSHVFRLPDEVKSWFRRSNGAGVAPGGLDSLFPRQQLVSLDWYFREYPDWKERGWIPLAGDGCGDLYVLAQAVVTPSTGTHPMFFLDQSDFTTPNYLVASGFWKFLLFYLEDELLREQGKGGYWPFDRDRVLAVDPAIAECRSIPLPWAVDTES